MRHQWPVRVLAHIEWSNPPPANPDGPGGAPKRGVPLAATATLVYSDGASATFHCGFDAARRNFLEVRSPTEHAPILHYLAPISRRCTASAACCAATTGSTHASFIPTARRSLSCARIRPRHGALATSRVPRARRNGLSTSRSRATRRDLGAISARSRRSILDRSGRSIWAIPARDLNLTSA